MTFAWPHVLWLLIVPIWLFAWQLARRARAFGETHPKIRRAEVGTHRMSLTPASSRASARRSQPWLAIGLALGIAALARPQWGRVEEPVFHQSREILIAVDLSRSMLSTDVDPSRLDRAKLLIQSLLEKLKGERVGLVVFSGTAFLQSPMSADYEILREFLPALKPSYLPEGGTNYDAMLETALDAFGTTSADRFLIVLSDGEATDDDWKSRLDELKKRQIQVIALGVGTAGGSMIPDGSGGFVKDDRGAVVLSRLESSTLKQLANATGGVYRDASTWIDIASLINQTVDKGRKGAFKDTETTRRVERYQWPLAFALWCLFASLCYEFPVHPRARDIRLQTPGDPLSTRKGHRGSRVRAGTGTLAVMAIGTLALAFAFPAETKAAASIGAPSANPPPATPSSSPARATQAPLSPLVRIVNRLSKAKTCSALDWSELAQETLSWGQRQKSAGQPVPDGPVTDALQAVDRGSKLDPHAAEWTRLRDGLEKLLEKKPPKSQPKKGQGKKGSQNNPKQNRSQNKGQSGSNSDQTRKQQGKSGASKTGPSSHQDRPASPNSRQQDHEGRSASNKTGGDRQQSNQSLFGNKAKQPPPQHRSAMQKIGGARQETDESKDPTMALPLQELHELKDGDSPAKLFELMQPRGTASQKKPKKDW